MFIIGWEKLNVFREARPQEMLVFFFTLLMQKEWNGYSKKSENHWKAKK